MDRPQTHWFYKRIKAANIQEQFYFELGGGLAFLLRRFHLIQPEKVTTAGPVTTGFPIVGAEFIDGTGAVRWQLQAIPANLYSSPRSEGVIIKTETAPADMTGYGVNMSAVFKPRSNTVNLFYDVGELITMKLTGFEMLTPPGYLCPNYVDVAIEGVYIPNMPNPENTL